MKLRAIRRLNVIATSLLVAGVLTMFSGLAASLIFNSERVSAFTFASGFAAVVASLLLCFPVDRVKCPQCGKPFNRPDYKNWFVRNFAKTQTHWSCVHCGHGGEDASAWPSR